MKLTDQQRRVISSTALQAKASVRQVAKETTLREHAVRYALDVLFEQGLVAPLPFIDISRLGLCDYCIYFSYLCQTEAERQQLLDFICSSTQVTWVVELGGEYQYAVALYGRTMGDVDQFLAQVAESCRGQLLNKAIAARVSWTLFRPKFLSAHQSAIENLNCGPTGERLNIDSLDQMILRALVRLRTPAYTAIAREAGVGKSTIEDRIRALEKNGVIKGYTLQLNTAKAGIHSLRIMLFQKQASEGLRRRLYEYASASPYITCLVHCVGNWDYELSVRVPELKEAPQIVQDIYTRFGNDLTGLRVLTVFERHKHCLFPFSADVSF